MQGGDEILNYVTVSCAMNDNGRTEHCLYLIS